MDRIVIVKKLSIPDPVPLCPNGMDPLHPAFWH